MTAATLPVSSSEFFDVVQAHLDGLASDYEVALLRSHEKSWVAALLRLLDDASLAIDRANRDLKGSERALVVADFEREWKRIDEVLTELVGPNSKSGPSAQPAESEPAVPVVGEGTAQIQLSWTPGKVVAWASGYKADAASVEELLELLKRAGAEAINWESYNSIKVPNQGRAPAVWAPIESCLGWLAALSTSSPDKAPVNGARSSSESDNGDGGGEMLLGVSAIWIGLVTALAIRLIIQGRMVPQVKKARRSVDTPKGTETSSPFEVRWAPALVDDGDHRALTDALPASVGVIESRPDAGAMTTAVLTDLVTAICHQAASRLDVPAPPPEANTKGDVAETFLALLDGTSFLAPSRLGSELARRIDQWAKPVTGNQKFKLVIQLDPPDESNAWYLAVLAPNGEDRLLPVEQVMVNSSSTRRKEVENELIRLERLYPELLRPGARRRGEVVLSQDEAWQLMTKEGQVLIAAGYEVRAPALSRKKPTPTLRLTSEDSQDTVVGAQQLANVRWSVIFDDIELTAEDISRLASQARPLVKSRGQWVELDQADLAEAAAALAERADQSRLSGADMLRHALGLEGSPFSGGVSLAGEGWAAELLQNAANMPKNPPTKLDGFKGELRSYQAEARAWLEFLDNVGLGGCLALDMGLGKTPTMLAHIELSKAEAPALVIAPPAVVGNWAAEAAKFVPGLKVLVHHGPNRAEGPALGRAVSKADLVITTYGTAVRDMDELEDTEWGKVVLDEAQAIKNPASDTAQQLRRLSARTRVALTGTPIENGLGDLWAIMDFTNPGLVGGRSAFVAQLSHTGDARDSAERALRALNGILVFRRTKAEPQIAAELPDRIDELDHCAMTPEQIGLYQAVLDSLVVEAAEEQGPQRKGAVLAAITALKQICNHPAAYQNDGKPLDGRSGKLARLNEIVDNVFVSNERVLIFTHFATWGERLAQYLSKRTGKTIHCYHGGLSRGARDRMVEEFQAKTDAGAMVLSLKAGGTGLNLTAASHVVLYDRWWNPAVEDQARDRVWRIGQKSTVICHRLVCPGTVDERVEEVVAGKRRIAEMVLPKSSSVGDLDAEQLKAALGLNPDLLLAEELETLSDGPAGNEAEGPEDGSDEGSEATGVQADAPEPNPADSPNGSGPFGASTDRIGPSDKDSVVGVS
ncbi:MAG: DEAD/DEAH box helicase [Acidimicrobiia bacterium]|nr:DEAD/DEAH box helicase [Acidimicrobiia bacterium]